MKDHVKTMAPVRLAIIGTEDGLVDFRIGVPVPLVHGAPLSQLKAILARASAEMAELAVKAASGQDISQEDVGVLDVTDEPDPDPR